MKTLLVLSLLGFSLSAYADIPPPPSSLRNYSVELSSDISATLLQSTNFQATKDIQVSQSEDPVFGPCTIQEKTWTGQGRFGASSLVCRTNTSCFYKPQAVCTLSFVGAANQTADSLLKVLSASPIN